MNREIDFVLLWVDGSDPKWQEEFAKYQKNSSKNSDRSKYRDWDNLRYLFRAFEEFTPWVRKVHFVTWGHLPDWLNIEHPKLNIVNHKDYIDKKFLPLFSSHPLEINMHNIKDLSNQFVYFNDDLFIIKKVDKERFFKNGLPRDALISNAISSSSGVGHFVLNNLEIINRHFNKKESIKRDTKKWFSLKYGKDIIRNIALLPWPRFTGFVDPHMPQPFLKSTFEEVWDKEEDLLEKTMSSRFRECSNVNQYLFRYWQLVKGNFCPISLKDTKYIEITKESVDSGEVDNVITSFRYNMICLNDSKYIDEKEFDRLKESIKNSFNKILPNRSSFEI
jgi:hypothetical protein